MLEFSSTVLPAPSPYLRSNMGKLGSLHNRASSKSSVTYLKYAGFVPRNALYGAAKNAGMINAETCDSANNWTADQNADFIINNHISLLGLPI